VSPTAQGRHDLANVLVMPMAGRLRASSYMEFAPPEAPADPRKATRLRQTVAAFDLQRFGARMR